MTAVLHHLALGARDVDRVATFYRDLLGLPERRRFDEDGRLRSIWLSLGQAVLMIERTAHERPQRLGVDAGAFLIAVSTSVDREVVRDRLQAAGFPRESATEFTDYYRDPEGNRVGVSRYPLGLPEPP